MSGSKNMNSCEPRFNITFIGPDESTASGRYRNIMPFRWLHERGWREGNDLLIVSKHAWSIDFTAGFARYIFDVCDDHFHTEWRDHYVTHCKKAARVICNSNEMKRVIHRETGVDAIVIPDPYEYPRAEPHTGGYLFYGRKWNLPPLWRVLPLLPPGALEVVADLDDPQVTPWSHKNMRRAFRDAGIVLIPATERKAKSANRLIEAINNGCFVCAEPIPAHEEFRPYAWVGDIPTGVTWALSHPEEAMERTRKGQAYIDQHYSMDAIGPRWEAAIRGALQPETVS